MLKKVYDEKVKNLRHEVWLMLPSGWQPPSDEDDLEDIEEEVKAVVRVNAVEWDHAEILPALIIHGDLIESKDLLDDD